MKLGGHQTFYPRPGWLTKGLLHLENDDSRNFALPDVADDLGVGRNMSKSIGWWLHATGLAVRTHTRPSSLSISDFGHAILGHDPYMMHLGTWWLIHASSLVTKTGTSLSYFFSPKRPRYFNRLKLVELLSQYLIRQNGNTPSLRSVQREVSTVLQAYAVPVPRPSVDPENNLGCPFQRLNLLRHIRSTDNFELAEPSLLPPEVLGLVLSALSVEDASDMFDQSKTLSISYDSQCMVCAAAILGHDRATLLDHAEMGKCQIGQDWMEVRFLAGERNIAVKCASPALWAIRYYERVKRKSQKMVA